jgi:hypothetical protein
MSNAVEGGGFAARVDCRGRRAGEILLQILPICLNARQVKASSFVIIENLELLKDSVTGLLKAFDRLAVDFGVRITLADSSGFGEAFLKALGGRAKLHVAETAGR